MTEEQMQDALYHCFAALVLDADQDEFPEEMPSELAGTEMVRTFADAGLLTSNKGVVLRMKDGREFQITVVRSR